MILLCGVPTESPLAFVRREVEAMGAPFVLFNQRRFADARLTLEFAQGTVDGELALDGRRYRLADFSGVYTRLMDDRLLPEIEREPPQSPLRAQCRAFHDLLTTWFEVTPARVVNRSAPMGSNSSKPYQAQLIREHGFEIPESLITNDPERALLFRRNYGRIIYKSISAVRSIVQEFVDDDVPRLDRIRWCPTMFQRRVDGTDVRVHVIGDTAIATSILTDTTDYRYAHHQGGTTELRAVELGEDIATRCIALAQALELDFAGIDLRINDNDGLVYCFEVNPSPAFSYYEQNTGQPIAETVARYLADA